MTSFEFVHRTFRALALAVAAAGALAGCSAGVDDLAPGAIRPSKSQFSGVMPHHFPIHGIDVSRYQGDIDWAAVKNGGVHFAYIKATEGGDAYDPKFAQNWAGAKAVGLPHGAYHFVYWCRPWNEEMAAFERAAPAERDALPPVLDVEATPTSRTCKRHLDREDVIREMRLMLSEMERHYGKKPVIYTTVDFYEAILAPNELDEYPIWVRSTKYSPQVKYGDRKWRFWQYQSDADVPGVSVKVDRNAFGGDERQWLAFAGG